MCLRINKRFGPLKKPIKVWKVGYKSYIYNVLFTPFRRARIPFDTEYTDPFFNSESLIRTKGFIHKGFIHSYIDYENAKVNAKYLSCNVFQAIIPAGACGYYGCDGDICSNKILVSGIIK